MTQIPEGGGTSPINRTEPRTEKISFDQDKGWIVAGCKAVKKAAEILNLGEVDPSKSMSNIQHISKNDLPTLGDGEILTEWGGTVGKCADDVKFECIQLAKEQGKDKEFAGEAEEKLKMLKEAKEQGLSYEHLDIEIEVGKVTESKNSQVRVGQVVTKSQWAAGGSLDGYLQREGKNLSLEQRNNLVKDVFSGVSELHNLGRVHRDLKLDNFLVFIDEKGNPHLKLSDFGKTQKSNKIINIYSGNIRNVAPEGAGNVKAEIYIASQIAISIIEAPYLKNGKPLLESNKTDGEHKPNKSRQGFEAFAIEDNAFISLENKPDDKESDTPKHQNMVYVFTG